MTTSKFTLLILICLNSVEIFSDDLEFRLVELRNDRKISGEYHVELQLRIIGGTFPRTLNSFTTDICFGERLIPYSTKPDSNWRLGNEYSVHLQKLSNCYRVLVIGSNVNANGYAAPPGFPPGLDVTNIWQPLVNLRWLIKDLGIDSIKILDETDAAAYFNNYTNAPKGNVTDWFVHNYDLDLSTPVELNFFCLETKGKFIELKWQSATELNNYGFEIERRVLSYSPSSTDWNSIGFLAGNGNSDNPKNYTFMDTNPTAGTKFMYRLKQIDFDGSFRHSAEVVAELIPDIFELHQNYPNPFNSVTNIRFELPKVSRVSLNVFSVLGEKIASLLDDFVEVGYHEIKFDASKFSSGIYICKFDCKEYTSYKKLILLK